MKEIPEENLLKVKHQLKINNIEYHELHPNTHFRIFIPGTGNKKYVDIWPTTLKWYDFENKYTGYGIESFIKFLKPISVFNRSTFPMGVSIPELHHSQVIIFGMTLREYYIGQAISGLCFNRFDVATYSEQKESFVEWASDMAIEIADKILEKLKI